MRLGLLFLFALSGASLAQSTGATQAVSALETFKKAEAAFKNFKALRIHGSQREQTRAVKALVAQMQQLTQMYRAVVQHASGDQRWAALYRLGSMYDLFAQKLDASPLPIKLTPDQAKLYRRVLADKVMPLREKAAKSFEMMIAKSTALGVRNQWTQAAETDLRRLSAKPAGTRPGPRP